MGGRARNSDADGPGMTPASAGAGESAHRPCPESGKRPAPDAAGDGRRSGVRGRVRGWRGRSACRGVRVRTEGPVRARCAARGDGRRRSGRGVGSSKRVPCAAGTDGRSPGAASRTRPGTGNAATPPVPPITNLHVRTEAKPVSSTLASVFEGLRTGQGSRHLVRLSGPPRAAAARLGGSRGLRRRPQVIRIPLLSARLGGFCVTRDTQ